MGVVHQFLFGYDDGHRLLAGSRELPPALLVRLLGATDASMMAACPPLVTGIALRETREYAVCVSWSAPEMPRGGAVWAHALLVGESDLRDPMVLDVLLGLPQRPPPGVLDTGLYSSPLHTDALPRRAPSYLPPRHPDVALLTRLAGAAYSGSGSGSAVLAQEDLADAANALVSLWRAQWPALRAAFSFRTREVARRGRSEFDLTVTAKIRGYEDRPGAHAARSPHWLAAIVADSTSPTGTALRDFVWTFGPQEPADPRRMRHLASLWLRVAEHDAERACRELERYWPLPRSGTALKTALFGRAGGGWWEVGERDRVNALLGAEHPAWDLEELELSERTRELDLGASQKRD